MLPLKDNVPTRHFPVVTVSLIAANVLFFLLVQDAGREPGFGASVSDFAYQPCEVNDSCLNGAVGEGPLLTAFTSMFMHGGWVHLIGNMLFLWIFGNNIEDAMGRFRFLLFYLLAGLAATALQTGVTLETASAQAAGIPNLGASGAVAGVLGAYFILLPTARILTLIVIVLREIPAFLYLLIWFAFQAWDANLQLEHPPEGGGVAVFAHLGGMVFGLVFVKLFQARDPLRPAY